MDREQALEAVLEGIREGSQSDFAKRAFLEMLRLLPPVPHVPGKEVFFELARKGVLLAVELVLVRDGQVYLTHREDEFFTGWHLPGTYREPRASLLMDAKRCAAKELGAHVAITKACKIGFEEHPDSDRFHDGGILTLCTFKGEPEKGQWFRERPPDLIRVHKKYWPTVELALRGDI